MFPEATSHNQSRCAYTELQNPLRTQIYKHTVPTGLSPSQRFLTLSSESFRVTYPANVDRRDANQVLSTLDSARADFLRRANADPPAELSRVAPDERTDDPLQDPFRI